MSHLKKNLLLFALGGIGYGIIELLWRGRTHWSMVVAGGLCFVMFSKIAKTCHRCLLWKAAFCAVGVTVVEFVFGLIFNVWLRKNVWDYSDVPLNVMGQICPLYTLLWGVLAFVILPVVSAIDKRLCYVD